MPDTDPDQRLIQGLAAHGETAFFELDKRFRERLCQRVRAKMNEKYLRREAPEDVVQSVFRTYFRRNAEGGYDLKSVDDLWNLLRAITRLKILKHVEYHKAASRDIDREVYEYDGSHAVRNPTSDERLLAGVLLDILTDSRASSDSPTEVYWLQLHGLEISEIAKRILDDLDSTYRDTLQHWLLGSTVSETADEMGMGYDQVKLRRKRLRERMARLGASEGRTG
ncbi:MAG: hypothetical protein MI757_09200 [Pirellulales bacterium]|nr:hypothetical protein [Pirellulales bacterium]